MLFHVEMTVNLPPEDRQMLVAIAGQCFQALQRARRRKTQGFASQIAWLGVPSRD